MTAELERRDFLKASTLLGAAALRAGADVIVFEKDSVLYGGNYSGPFYVGCGWSITNTVVWGREAGQNVAALESWEA